MSRIFFISIAVFVSFNSFAQRALLQSKDDTVIRKMLANQVIEWNKGNIEGYMKGYWESDSLIFIGSSEQRYGYRATLERYKTTYPDKAHMGRLTLTVFSIKRLSDDYYFVVGRWGLQRNAGDIGGPYSLLIKRINEELVIIVDHSS